MTREMPAVACRTGVDTSYEPFSREPEYIELNRLFIESLGLRGPLRLVDLACGTGTLIRLTLDRLGPGASALGVDISRRSLQLARQDLGLDAGAGQAPPVILIEASADRLPVRAGSADAVLIGNAIHCFTDLDRLLREVGRILRPGGCFAFNSSFYAGTFVPGTERFYDEWMKEAARYLLKKQEEERREGRGFRRLRGTVAPAFSRRWLSPDEFARALEGHGLRVAGTRQRTVMMGRHAFETVGAYEGLAAVLLSGFPVDLACEALTRSVAAGLLAVGMEMVPRYWLEMTAMKEGPAA